MRSSHPLIQYINLMRLARHTRVSLYAGLSAFIVFAAGLLYINREVLYTAADRSEFIYGETFYNRLASKPFGLMQYAGAWLTQLFYKPVLGAGVLMAIWTLIFLAGIKAFRLKGNATALMLLPVACLLTSVTDIGYWVYTSPIRGYWFSQSLGYLAMLLLVWAARSTTPRRWHIVWYLVAAGIYPVLGWFALLFILCLATPHFLPPRRGERQRGVWGELAGLVLLAFAAGIWHTQAYPYLSADDVMMAGLPRFETPSDSTPHLSYPFWVLGAVSVAIPLCCRWLNRWFTPWLCTTAAIGFTWSLMYDDRNFIDEMRMLRYACDDHWQEVLTMANETKRPTRTMEFLQNVALMHEGGLLDKAFKLNNNSVDICNPDSLHITLLDIASPVVYYNYGMTNEAIRLCFENAIQAGFSPFFLKMLSRCAQAQGDSRLMERYNAVLHHHPFYRDWHPAPASATIKELQQCYPDEITGVENSDSYLVNSISLWSDTDSKVASEQALFYAMLRCDSRRFWPALRQYVRLHMNEQFPLHAQEAYILFMDKAPEEKRMMLPVEQSVYERYKRFWSTLESQAKPGMTIGKVGEDMREAYGDTYWWHNIFGKKIY